MILGHCAPTWTGGLTSSLTYRTLTSHLIFMPVRWYCLFSFMGGFWITANVELMRLKMDFYVPEGAPDTGNQTVALITKIYSLRQLSLPNQRINGNGGGGSYWVSGSKKTRAQNFVDNSECQVKNINRIHFP